MNLPYRSALVTGGAGFIGSHIVDALVGNGCRVSVIDNLTTGNETNLAHIIDKISFYKGDIRDTDLLEKSAAGCDIIFHLAAIVSVPETVADPIASAGVNDFGTLLVLETARKMNVRRVVLSSSCAVYGDDPHLPKNEGMAPKPCSPYAVHKLSGELHARLYFELYGLETVCLRYFNVFGPRQDPSSPYSGVISIFMARAAAGKSPLIYGDGTQSRDFIFVQDVVQANLQAAGLPSVAGGICNVGSGNSVSINQLWEMIGSLDGSAGKPDYAPVRSGDILHSVADISLAETVLEFEPQVDLAKGLAQTYSWYRDTSF